MQIHKKSIEASVGSTVVGIVNKLFDMFDKFLSKLADKGDAMVFAIETDKTPENTPVDKWPYRCKVEYVDSENSVGENDTTNQKNIYNIYLKKIDPDGNKANEQVLKQYGVKLDYMINGETEKDGKSILTASFEDYFEQKFDSAVHGDEMFQSFEVIDSSTQITVTLSKITCAESTDIQLSAVDASAPTAALIALESVLADDDFVEGMPEGTDITYEIDVADDGYDVTECEDFEPNMPQVFQNILQKLYQLQLLSSFNKCCCRSECTYKLEQVYWMCESQIAWFNKRQHALLGYCENPIDLIQSATSSDTITTVLSELINALDLYWCNFDHADQQVINRFIDEWRTGVEIESL